MAAPSTETLTRAFHTGGHQLWLVGGAVRDKFLGEQGGDADYTTSAMPDQVLAIAAAIGATASEVGIRFGTVGVLLAEGWAEITTFRGDSYSGGSRWPEVTFGSSIEEDLARRDFTINAMARNTATGVILDPYDGRGDLNLRLIRAVGTPALRYAEDPLRILRGIRFAAQLGFAIEAATEEGMRATVDLLETLSQERTTAEIDRLLQSRWPARGLRALEATGALAGVLPELAAGAGCEQNSFHRFDCWGHTVATVEAVDPTENARVRRWAALLHDIGKPAVRHRKENGEWGFYRHDAVGEELATELLDRLLIGKREAAEITLLVRRHMDRPNVDEGRSVRRFIRRLEGRWRDMIALKRADNASHTYDDSEYLDALEAACLRAETEDAEALRAESPLTGTEILALAPDRHPGSWVGTIKDHLSNLVLDGDLAPGDRPEAERIAREMLEGI